MLSGYFPLGLARLNPSFCTGRSSGVPELKVYAGYFKQGGGKTGIGVSLDEKTQLHTLGPNESPRYQKAQCGKGFKGFKGNLLSEEAEIAKERRGNNSFLKPPPRGMATRWTDRGTCPQAAGEKTNTRKKKVLLRAGGPLTTKQDHQTRPHVVAKRLPKFQNEPPSETSETKMEEQRETQEALGKPSPHPRRVT